MSCIKVQLNFDKVKRTPQGYRQRSIQYRVEFDTAVASTLALEADDGTDRIPQNGEVLDGMTVTDADADRIKDFPLQFFVNVRLTDEPNQVSAAGNPLDRPAAVSWSFIQKTEAVAKAIGKKIDGNDAHDLFVTNTANEPFSQLLERDDDDLICTVTRNQSYFDVGLAYNYRRAVNDGAFQISDGTETWNVPDKLAKIGPITSSERLFENGQYYYRVSYPIRIRKEGWRDTVDSRGRNALDDNGKVKPIIDPNTQEPISFDYPLDATGQAKGLPKDAPSQIEFQKYEELSFAVFNFQVPRGN